MIALIAKNCCAESSCVWLIRLLGHKKVLKQTQPFWFFHDLCSVVYLRELRKWSWCLQPASVCVNFKILKKWSPGPIVYLSTFSSMTCTGGWSAEGQNRKDIIAPKHVIVWLIHYLLGASIKPLEHSLLTVQPRARCSLGVPGYMVDNWLNSCKCDSYHRNLSFPILTQNYNRPQD